MVISDTHQLGEIIYYLISVGPALALSQCDYMGLDEWNLSLYLNCVILNKKNGCIFTFIV